MREISNIHAKKRKLLGVSHRVRKQGVGTIYGVSVHDQGVYGSPEGLFKALTVYVCFSSEGTRTFTFMKWSNAFDHLKGVKTPWKWSRKSMGPLVMTNKDTGRISTRKP